MRTVMPSRLLRTGLLVDILLSGAIALLQLVAADWLSANLALPRTLLVESGVFMLGYVLILVVLARREQLHSAVVIGVVIGNAVWALLCGGLLFSGAVSPSTMGIGFVLLQADAVLVFAVLQWRGLVRSETMRESGAQPLAG